MSDNISEELKKRGLKNTKHRAEILDMLKRSDQPVSAEQLFKDMLDRNINVNFSTVYRTLDTLCEKDLVSKLTIESEGGALYEFNSTMHKHHLICLGCRKIISLDYCPLGNYEQTLAEKTDYLIAGHKLDIYGYCPECRKTAHEG
ncbi:MAG: Fur family transcriptional regulator [Eubacteriales bacterium]|nr:Fur family transcriptional regulator [Eubacteriales bacterium]